MEVTGYAIQVVLNAVAYERLTLAAYDVEHCGDTVGALADTLRKAGVLSQVLVNLTRP